MNRAARFILATPLFALLTLSGCSTLGLGGALSTGNALQAIEETTPQGSSFHRALFENYANLARSLQSAASNEGAAFDASSSNMIDPDTVWGIAMRFADKALIAGKGQDIAPEQAQGPVSEQTRNRVVTAINQARTYAPDLSARVQADFDCWQLNRRVATQQAGARACKQSLDSSLPQLEARTSWTRAQPRKP